MRCGWAGATGQTGRMPPQFAFAPAVMEEPMAAFYISVSPRKLQQMAAAGRVTRYRLDGKKVYKRDELDLLVSALPEWRV